MSDGRNVGGIVLLAGCVIATLLVYLVLVPRSVVADEHARALRYLVVGWLPYTLAFYMVGRLFSSPSALPTMRTADVGLGVFLVSLLVSLGLDAWGFSPELVPVAHVLQAVAIFASLALLGWGIGRRSRAIAGDE
ncbi:hypothetical protein [Natrarchaeobius oligotrophus]|uniref:Uncharacterized protein n=1 Tax=Natrarchaeobius chitinivorans TaxID=1679083 RepID=A0A3N6MEZ6_NATCH|nr:hypothetical protein [Natrarchaeobius chitinivorans]RQH02499.1 hypothetical protein EA472_04140 [Natrarchaeobius chitinivorans]